MADIPYKGEHLTPTQTYTERRRCEEAHREGGHTVCFPVHYAPSEQRISNVKRLNDELFAVLNNYKSFLERPYIALNCAPKMTVENFKNTVRGISMLSGCSVRLFAYSDLICDKRFDANVFKGFLLSMLMLGETSSVPVVNLIITLVLICTGIVMLNYKKEK